MTEPEKPIHYQCELYWTWGRSYRFDEVHRFSVLSQDEIDGAIQEFIKKMVSRYAFDCGNLDQPLNPWVSYLRVTPVYSYQTFDDMSKKYGALIDSETAKRKAELEAR